MPPKKQRQGTTKPANSPAPGPAPISLLSPRELEILELRRRGHTYKEIANHLNISIHTIKTHTARTFAKVQVQNTLAAIYKLWFCR